MNIDIEKLKVDESLWPDGATHFVPGATDGFSDVFWRVEGDKGVEAWAVGMSGLVHYPEPSSAYDTMPEAIPRPTKPQAPEWDGEGLPPVGFTQQDCELVGVEGFHQGFEVVAHKGVAAIVWGSYEDDPEGQVETLLASHFSPIRTKEERQREEIKRELCQFLQSRLLRDCSNITESILNKYDLTRKGDS